MNGFLLDTNVISELVKPDPDPNVLHWIEETDESLLFLSVITLGEIRHSIERLTAGKRRGRLRIWLQIELPARFRNRILPIDELVAHRWGALSAVAAAIGKPVPVVDGLLAATAVQHELILVTRNAPDVAGTAVPTLNPWK